MFLGKCNIRRVFLFGRSLIDCRNLSVKIPQKRFYSYLCAAHIKKLPACCVKYSSKDDNGRVLRINYKQSRICHRQCSSQCVMDEVITKLHQRVTKSRFLRPRVLLNELSTQAPEKIFHIEYKKNVTMKGTSSKKKMIQSGWTCMYSFVWPEKIKFEGTATSKSEAAEQAATSAVQWLFENKRITKTGRIIFDRDVLNDIKNKLDKEISISLCERSMERIDSLWDDYKNSIKPIYEATFVKSRSVEPPQCIVKDSTLEEEDDLSVGEVQREGTEDLSEITIPVHPVYGRVINPPTERDLRRREQSLKRAFELYQQKLTPLPIDGYTEQITSTLENNRVSIIVGAPGCGKSTRVPAAILRANGVRAAVLISQPRRVAAIGLAQRVASEMGEEVGESIGFQVRLHSLLPEPPSGSVLFCTSGILLNRLQLNPGLQGCTHVIIDEAHSRDVNTDISMLLLKRALDINPELKLLIMSATLDIEVFTRYFEDCPIVEVPGRTFPVEIFNLDDIQRRFDLSLPNSVMNSNYWEFRTKIDLQEIVEVIKAVDKREPKGAILVFLPGWSDIRSAMELLQKHYGGSPWHMILPVHSRLSMYTQTKMFSKPPEGVRKIILATNIAETSITVPDVVFVIDSGAHKQSNINLDTGIAHLESVWVSQSAAKQRAGRAGRVQDGKCFKMYTKEKEAGFVFHDSPEILRKPLEEIVFLCKSYAPDENVKEFMSQLPDPPPETAIQRALDDLIDVGALTTSEDLTHLGASLSKMSLHPRLARTLLNAAVAGCMWPVSNMVTCCSNNVDLFQADDMDSKNVEIREIKRKFSKTSDHAALYRIQHEFEKKMEEDNQESVKDWCTNYGLRQDKLIFIKSVSNLNIQQALQTGLADSLPVESVFSRSEDVDELAVASLLSGTDSLLVTKRHVKTKGKLKIVGALYTSKGDSAQIGSESVNYNITKTTDVPNFLAYFGGHHSHERRALIVHMTSLVTPHMALMFCKGDLMKNAMDENTTELVLPRHNIGVHIPTRDADIIVKAKEMLWSTFGYYLEYDRKDVDPDQSTAIFRFKDDLMNAIRNILVEAQTNNTTKL